MHTIQPVILSGGSGTRLWPMSRQSLPKQLLPLTGEKSLLQQTALRVSNLLPPIIIANEEHRFVVAQQMQEIGVSPKQLVLEPCGRNTAPAAAIASLLVPEDTLLLVLPADHHIADVVGFHADIQIAAASALKGKIATLGLKPKTPETGYGYLELGAPLDGVDGAFLLSSFTEKPVLEKAQELVGGGKHLWNSGMFVFQAGAFLKLLANLQPEILRIAQKSVEQLTKDMDFVRLNATLFGAMPSISIDYAVMEHTENGAVIPARFDWCDLGAWDALWDIAAKDSSGNALIGNTVAVDIHNSYVRSEGILTTVLGLDDIVVVTTKDAVLVTHRSKAQQLRLLAEELKNRNQPELYQHKKTYRPWGYYESLDSGMGYQVKRLVIHAGAKISLQKHHKRAEHWVVVEGVATVTLGDKELQVCVNESVYIPPETIHRIENKEKFPLTIIEVQSGSYLGEDDIVRLEDSYGRVEK